MPYTNDPRVEAGARRWFVAYQQTLATRLATTREKRDAAAWDLMRLMMEEITDIEMRREFVWLVVNGGEV